MFAHTHTHAHIKVTSSIFAKTIKCQNVDLVQPFTLFSLDTPFYSEQRGRRW